MIFISYRRDDSAGWTGRLDTDLRNRFGQETVWRDIDNIAAGEDFNAAIERSLESCHAVLVVIGPEWSLAKDSEGIRRLDNPEDKVRLEVAKALARKSLVIPVLVGGAQLPTADALPPDLKELADRNAVDLSDSRWNYDFEGLAISLLKRSSPKRPRWLRVLSRRANVLELSDKRGEQLAISLLKKVCGGLVAIAVLALVIIGIFSHSQNSLKQQAAIEYAEAERLRLKGLNYEARKAFNRALTLYEQVQDRLGQANVLLWLGILETTLGQNDQAREAFYKARDLFKEDRLGQANVLLGLGKLETTLGRKDKAREAFKRAFDLFKEDRLGQANVFNMRGDLESKLGRNDKAREAYEEALTLFVEQGSSLGQGEVRRGIGDLEYRLGHYYMARKEYEEALTLFVEQGSSLGRAYVLRGLGSLDFLTKPQQALDHFVEAAQLFGASGVTKERDAAVAALCKLGHRGQDQTP